VSNFRWGLIAAIAAFFISTVLGIISGVNVSYIFIRAFLFAALFFAFGFGLRFMISSFFPELLYSEDESYSQDGIDQAGSRVSITLDSTGEYAVPELFKTTGDAQEMGNIEDLISGYFKPRAESAEESRSEGIDLKKEEGYNSAGSKQGFLDDVIGFDDGGLGDLDTTAFEETAPEKPPAPKPAFTPSFGDDSGLNGLPDLDMMAMAFSGVESRVEPLPVSSAGFGDSSPGLSIDEDFESEIPAPAAAPVKAAQSGYVGNKPQPLKGDFDPKELAKGISTVLSKDK